MTTFEEYFKESGLPFIHDDGYIEHKSGYTIGRADYDEFDDYKPMLDVLSAVYKQHPELFDNIDDLNEHECELSCDNRDITISLWNGDLSVSQKHSYSTSVVAYKEGGKFSHSDHINFTNGFDGDVNQLLTWLDESDKDSRDINNLLKTHHVELHNRLIDEGVNRASDVLPADEYTYRRIGNAGDLRARVENANIGKILKRDGYDGVIVQVDGDWLMDCLDYEKDGQKFIRADIFWDMSNEVGEVNRSRELAVSCGSSAYQMIPSERFSDLAPKLLSNFNEFKRICREESEKLEVKFDTLDGHYTYIPLTNEDLAWENALYQ